MALLAATSARDVARLRELLAGGARVWACEWRDPALEARDERGYTAFLMACLMGQAECAEALLAAGCDASAESINGTTALMIATVGGHAALLPRLLASGAPLEARDGNGRTAFLMACTLGKAECARVLARRGATEPRAMPLARARGHHALADWLAAVDGFTPLHWACESRDPARVLAALQGDAARDAGARCGADGAGPTALELVTRPEAFPHTPSPVRKETAALVRAALALWSPLTHRVQTAAFRRGVLAVLCVGARLRHDAVAPRRRRLRGAPSPLLPPEVWLVVLSHCARDWWVA